MSTDRFQHRKNAPDVLFWANQLAPAFAVHGVTLVFHEKERRAYLTATGEMAVISASIVSFVPAVFCGCRAGSSFAWSALQSSSESHWNDAMRELSRFWHQDTYL